jgi:hypothetical protein
MSDDKSGKMIYVWGDPTFVVSNFDPEDGHTMYPEGCVAITVHFNGKFENAGSLQYDKAFFVSENQLPDLIEALSEFWKIGP